MQISFSAKIPVSKCQIYDRNNSKFIPATLYQFDCWDKSDVDYFEQLDEDWQFKRQISDDIKCRYNLISKKRRPYDTLTLNEILTFSNVYYTLETQDGNTACICEADPFGKELDIEFIESNKARFKYAGQALLASLAKIIKDTDKTMVISNPLPSARGFYSSACEFKKDNYRGYMLKQEDIEEFISRTQKRLKSEIIDYTC